jgi:hypothetical protein
MRNVEAKEFHDCARYALMLAEQLEQREVRDNLLRLVRGWMTAAMESEQGFERSRVDSATSSSHPSSRRS